MYVRLDARNQTTQCPVRSAMSLSVQIFDPFFKIIFRVVTPCLAIDSWRGLLLQVEETCAQ